MKTFARWLAVAGVCLAATGEAGAELVAWWPFDTVELPPGRDASPGGRLPLSFLKGELAEGRIPDAFAWNTGGIDYALQNSFPATAAFSFAAWVRREPGRGDSQAEETVVRLGDRSNAGWALYAGRNGRWNAYAYGAETRRLDARVPVEPGKWTHVALTFSPRGEPDDGGVGLLSLYIDGRLANQGEFEIAGAGSSAVLMLGARYAKGTMSWPFGGQMSQAAVWDEALSPATVAQLAMGVTPGQTTAER